MLENTLVEQITGEENYIDDDGARKSYVKITLCNISNPSNIFTKIISPRYFFNILFQLEIGNSLECRVRKQITGEENYGTIDDDRRERVTADH